MKVTFQVSLYPIAKKDFKEPINKFISNLRSERLDVAVHETSTIGSGEIGDVFDALKNSYAEAAGNGDVVMVITVVNGAPSNAELKKLNNR